MNAQRRVLLRLSVTMAIFAIGCVDLPTSPASRVGVAPGTPASDLLGDSSGVEVIRRQTPLAEDVVVTHTIGLLGGVIEVPDAGLVVVVPPLALLTPTAITVVAPAGDLVGYHFYPEGLTFGVPLIARQSLLGTEQPAGANLVAAFVEGDLAPTMEALELLPIDVAGPLASFPIHHFSGYVVATD